MPGITITETIAAPPEKVFARATDFPNAANIIQGIEKMEMLTEGPVEVGTRFRETRKMFGKLATEEMEVKTLDPPRMYALGAESHGSRYHTEFRFEPVGDGTRVTMEFQGEPLTMFAKVMTVMMKPMMKSMAKLCAKDLADLKAAVEADS